MWTDRRAVAPDGGQQEGREQQAGQQPTIETDLGRLNGTGRQLGDHGVAGPDKDGEQGVGVIHGAVTRVWRVSGCLTAAVAGYYRLSV
ncbi:hypothetical protein D3C80_2030760 [compost metagenome]